MGYNHVAILWSKITGWNEGENHWAIAERNTMAELQDAMKAQNIRVELRGRIME